MTVMLRLGHLPARLPSIEVTTVGAASTREPIAQELHSPRQKRERQDSHRGSYSAASYHVVRRHVKSGRLRIRVCSLHFRVIALRERFPYNFASSDLLLAVGPWMRAGA